MWSPAGVNIINVGDKRTTLKQAVGNGLDRSAGTMTCHAGNNPTTERSRPFPTYSIGGNHIILRKILRFAQDDNGWMTTAGWDDNGGRFIRAANFPRRGDPMWSPAGVNIINVGDKRTTLKQAVGNGLDRSAGTMSCNVGNNPTTERSRPFPTYSIGGCGESCGKILSAPVVILSEAKDLVRATT